MAGKDTTPPNLINPFDIGVGSLIIVVLILVFVIPWLVSLIYGVGQ